MKSLELQQAAMRERWQKRRKRALKRRGKLAYLRYRKLHPRPTGPKPGLKTQVERLVQSVKRSMKEWEE